MKQNVATDSTIRAVPDGGKGRFATLTFERDVAAPASVLWKAWTDPAARAVWAAPTPSVTVEFVEADTRVGGREISLCKVAGRPDIRCEIGWLVLQPVMRSVNYEVISSAGVIQSVALVTADISGTDERSRLIVTVQLSSLAADMEAGLPGRLRRGSGQSRGRGATDHGAAAGDPRAAIDRVGRVGEP